MAETCFFCSEPLDHTKKGNVFNIFQTVVYPLERKAFELIEDMLDIQIIEENAHSDSICKVCFKSVNEFANLESRAGEIRLSMLTNYKSTVSNFIGEEGVTVIEEEEEEEEEPAVEQEVITSDQLKEVIRASGGTLKEYLVKGKDGSVQRSSVLVMSEDEEGEEIMEEEVVEERLEGEEEVEYVRQLQEEKDGSIDVSEILTLEDGAVVCQLCGQDTEPFVKELRVIHEMEQHLENEHGINIMLCKVCAVGFARRGAMSMHMMGHEEADPEDLKCDICGREFDSVRLLRVHHRTHAVRGNWACEYCPKRFCSKNLRDEHTNGHLGVRPYVCDICDKSFASKYSHRAHQKIHEERERNYNCKLCTKSFMTIHNLQQHERTHDTNEQHVCPICFKHFASARSLEVHGLVHTGIKPYPCNVCGKKFARKAEIRDHERTHTGERPFECDICQAKFSQRSNLVSHKRVTHFDDRRYGCGDCGKTFKRRRLLDYHVKAVHTGERPYQCDTCQATFVYPEHFKKHSRIHSGLKPYKCEVCDKAFNSRDNRNAHRFVHSDKKPYECLVCRAGFMRKPLLYNHMQSAGHMNDTIVVNQPRVDKDDEAVDTGDEDYEFAIVETDEHEGKRIKWESSDLNGAQQIVDEDGNVIEVDGNIISLVESMDGDETLMATINEHGQLVNDKGQIIAGSIGDLIVDESMSEEVMEEHTEETVSAANNEDDTVVKTEPGEVVA